MKDKTAMERAVELMDRLCDFGNDRQGNGNSIHPVVAQAITEAEARGAEREREATEVTLLGMSCDCRGREPDERSPRCKLLSEIHARSEKP